MNFNNLRNKEKSIILRDNFRKWKFDSLDKAGYFVIFQGFEENGMLSSISGNALKLYIYLGLNSNNYEGIVWHSNEKIAKYFGKSERTIRDWMKELENMKLIKRMRLKYDGRVYTYIQPYIAKIDKIKTTEEGIIYFNNRKELCFQTEFCSRVLYEEIYKLTLSIDNVGLVKGILKREHDSNKDYYIFEDTENEISKFEYESNPGLLLKAVLEI